MYVNRCNGNHYSIFQLFEETLKKLFNGVIHIEEYTSNKCTSHNNFHKMNKSCSHCPDQELGHSQHQPESPYAPRILSSPHQG